MSGNKGGGSQVIGYRYFFGIHMGLGRGPVDEVCEVKVGDRTAWTGSITGNQTINIDQPSLFGGEKKEGGIQGRFSILMGEAGQTAESVLGELYDGKHPSRITVTGIPDGGSGVYVNSAAPNASPDYSLGDWRIVLTTEYVVNGYDESGNPILVGSETRWCFTRAGVVRFRARTTGQATPDQVGGWDSLTYQQGGWNWETGQYDTVLVMQPVAGITLSPFYNNLPGFRGMLTAFFDGIISMNNPYPKPWKFRVRRLTKGWDGDVWQPGLARIVIGSAAGDIHAMNPAHIVYECVTNRVWGRGLPRSGIDEASFLSAAQTLASEGFGLCLRWNRSDNVKAFVQGVLDHIGGVLFTSRSTGLLVLRLIRGGYDFNSLPHFTPDTGLLAVTDSAIASLGQAVNQMKVSYVDPKTGEDKSVVVSNVASIQAQGGVVNSQSKEYKGLPTAELATRVAQRDLRAASVNLRRFTLTLDRRGRAVEPGGVFLISDPSRGIPITPVRVGSIEDTSLTDGKINLVVAQDVFELPRLSWSVEVPNSWTPPQMDACLDVHKVFEVPYFMLAANLRRADLAFVDSNDGYLGAVCAPGKSVNAGYRIAVRDGASTPDDIPASDAYFCGYTPPGA